MKKQRRFTQRKKVISLGGGIQSVALTLASLHGIVERADLAMFADAGWERPKTYEMIDRLTAYAKDFDFPIIRLKTGDIREDSFDPKIARQGFLPMPVHTVDQVGKKHLSKKQCTSNYKIQPMRKKLRDMFGKNTHFEQWIGISLDETQRMRTSDVQYITLRYPLVEIRWTRKMCVQWLHKNSFPVPVRSACVGCPLHNNAGWKNLTDDEKQEAIEFDERIRHVNSESIVSRKPKESQKGQGELLNLAELDEKAGDLPVKRNRKTELFLHQSGLPLREVLNDGYEIQPDLFDMEMEECSGMCFL